MEILIFKTNIHCDCRQRIAESCLATMMGIQNWTIDRDDADRVLRIVATGVSIFELKNLIEAKGIAISLLKD